MNSSKQTHSHDADQALIQASFENNLPLVKHILKTSEVNINGKSPSHHSKDPEPNALHWALQNGNEEIALFLLSKGANPYHPGTLPKNFEELVSMLPDTGGFELTMRLANYKYEKENPQRSLELYCQEATLTPSILKRLQKMGADVHCCNDYALHLCIAGPEEGERDHKKIAQCVATLRDAGASMTAKSLNLTGSKPFEKAMQYGYTQACKEILKGYAEEELCTLLRTINDKDATKLIEKEIEDRLSKFPDSILERYKERASTQLPEFLKFAVREETKRESLKVMKRLKKIKKIENTISI